MNTQVGSGAAPRLSFDSVTKSYGPIAAVTDVSFRVGREVVGLVGRNGVGKSTLMKLAAGLIRPDQGVVRVDGMSAHMPLARASMGFCPDIERLYEDRSGCTFVAWMLRFHGLSRGEARRRAREVLVELGLEQAMDRAIRGYSKGMRQRVRLAQALAHRPSLLLLDEPMTGLDPLARADLARRIRALPGTGVGVLVSSHVLHELEAVADRIVLVHQGRLAAEGRIAELRKQLPRTSCRVRIVAPRPRELAGELAGWDSVTGVRVDEDGVEVEVADDARFYVALTEHGARREGGLAEVVPLGDDLASVFGHLIG